MPRLIAAITIMALVTGCQFVPMKRHTSTERGDETPPPDVRTVRVIEQSQTAELLRFYRDLAELSNAELDQQLGQLNPDLTANRCTVKRLKSAMIVTRLPRSAVTYDVQTLLSPCLEDPDIRQSAEGGLALLLDELIDTRSEHLADQRKLSSKGRQLENARLENQRLRKQLEGLKAIERSIQKRDRRIPAEE